MFLGNCIPPLCHAVCRLLAPRCLGLLGRNGQTKVEFHPVSVVYGGLREMCLNTNLFFFSVVYLRPGLSYVTKTFFRSTRFLFRRLFPALPAVK